VSKKINLYSNLQRYTGNQTQIDTDGNTVGQCLNNLVKKYPAVKPVLFDKSGNLFSTIFISINLDSPNPEKLDRELIENDQIYIIQISAGG
jgi:molybdopterin converting factor small subunit